MKKRVLIIEDHEKSRMLEKDLLEVAGFEVFESVDGASGIALAQKGKPDVIIMDLRLPDMPGIQAAMSLRQERETCDIPIVFVTAFLIGEAIQKIQDIPNAFFLTKPIDTRTFAKEIRQCIPGGLHE